MKKNWILKENKHYNILVSILKNREIENIESYLNPKIEDLNDFTLLKDIDKAVDRIFQALINKEKIMIFGHDDVDGITSVFILYNYLTKLGSQYHYSYIPNREIEGHGMKSGFINKVKEIGINLVITVDGGICCYDKIEALSEMGIDTIITDHHIPPEKLPNAYAIINPKQADCKYPFDMLAGVGVTYALISIMSKKTGIPLSKDDILMTALGTIADRVPLICDNRIFSKIGLRYLRTSRNKFINFVTYQNSELSTNNLLNLIIKLMNAGRSTDGNHLALEVLFIEDYFKIRALYNKLSYILKEYDIQQRTAFALIDELYQNNNNNNIFIHLDDNAIPLPLIGSVASYVNSKYHIPAVILKSNGQIITAEARGPEGFNFVELFNSISDLLIQYGGHKRAAGFSAELKNYEHIRNRMIDFVSNGKYNFCKKDDIVIDYQLDKHAFDMNELININKQMYPFGENNYRPIYLIKNLPMNELYKFPFSQGAFQNIEGEILDIVFTVDEENSRLCIVDCMRSGFSQNSG